MVALCQSQQASAGNTVAIVTGKNMMMHARTRGEFSRRPVRQNQTPYAVVIKSKAMIEREAHRQRCVSSKAVTTSPCEAQPMKAPACANNRLGQFWCFRTVCDA